MADHDRTLTAWELIGNRRSQFTAQAKSDDGVNWRIHMFADCIPSSDSILTTNPFAVMVKMHEEWVKTVTEKRRK